MLLLAIPVAFAVAIGASIFAVEYADRIKHKRICKPEYHKGVSL